MNMLKSAPNFYSEATPDYFKTVVEEMLANNFVWVKIHAEKSPIHGSIVKFKIPPTSLNGLYYDSNEGVRTFSTNSVRSFMNVRLKNPGLYDVPAWLEQDMFRIILNNELENVEWLPEYKGGPAICFDRTKLTNIKNEATISDCNGVKPVVGSVVVAMTNRKYPYNQVIGVITEIFDEKYTTKRKEKARVKPVTAYKRYDRELAEVETINVTILTDSLLSMVTIARLQADD